MLFSGDIANSKDKQNLGADYFLVKSEIKPRSQQKQLDEIKPVRLTLSQRGKEILELLGFGNPPSKVADAIGITRPTMTYWIKKLKKLEYLRLKVIDRYHYYELTHRGLKILTGSEEDFVTLVLEDYPVKFDVVSWGRADGLSWEKLGEPRNWVKLGFKLGSISVVRTSRSVIVHPGQLKGDDSYHLIFVATQVCNRVVRWLESKTDIVLRPGEPLRTPMFHVFDRVSEEFTKSFTFKNEDGEGADRSPPARKGHWDLGPESANNLLRSTGRLKLLSQQMQEITERLENIESGMLTSLDAWTKVGNRLLELLERVRGESQPPLKEMSGDYIT